MEGVLGSTRQGDWSNLLTTVTVELKDVPSAAITRTLLAIESFAERMYYDRKTNPDSMEAYNSLASVVLPLRDARDKALADHAALLALLTRLSSELREL